MPISTNGTVIVRLAGGLYNTVISNATYNDVSSLDPSALANTLYSRDFASKTDLAVATTLVTNLGLTSVTGLANWVAAQLTAAGNANKGAKVVELLNSFAQLTSDATYGAFATAFNTKVDSALAASQKTGTVEGVFASAGAVSGVTFALTAGADTWTGSATDDTVNATVAALGALDVIDGGAGNDTLNINDTASVKTLGGATVSNVEKFVVTSAGTVGNAAASATIAAKQSQSYDWSVANAATPPVATGVVLGGDIVVTIGGVNTTIAAANAGTAAAAAAAAVAAINTTLQNAYGNALTYATVATGVDTTNSKVVVTSAVAGTALPSISFSKGTGNTTLVAPAAVVAQPNQVAADAVGSNTFSSPATVENVISAGTEAYVSAAATAKTSVTAGTNATVSGGTDVTISAGDSVSASGAKGAVVVSATAPSVSIAASSTAGWSAGAGVFVRNGTTVTVSEKAGTYSSSSNSAPGNTTSIQIGSNPANATGQVAGAVPTATADGFPQAIGNLSSAPTGNVTTSVLTAYTDTTGFRNVKYGAGDVKIFMNGGSTASVTGASTVAIRDMQTIATKSTSTATAAPGTSNLTTVNLAGVSGATTLDTDALVNLSVIDSNSAVTLNSNTGKNAGGLNLTVGNSTTTVSASNVTSVAVTGAASAYQKIAGVSIATGSNSALTLTTPKATTLSFAGAADVTLASSTLAALTSITDTSASKVTLGDVTGYTKLSSIDASGASGALSATVGGPGTSGMTVKGGTAGDTVTLKAGSTVAAALVNGVTVTTSVDLGAGNDKLLDGGNVNAASSAAVGVGAVIDGGSGTDTVSASLVNAGNGGLFRNFEILELRGSVSSGGSGSIDASLLTNSTITGVTLAGTIDSVGWAGVYTVSNVSGTALTVGVTGTSANAGGNGGLGDVVATLATSTGAADTVSFNYTSTSGGAGLAAYSTLNSFKTTGIESVTIASGGTLAAATDTITNSLISLIDTSNKTASITITGDRAFTLGGFTQGTATPSADPTANQAGAMTLIDGSSATGVLTITGGTSTTLLKADGTNSTFSNTYTGLTINGGAGADVITNNARAGVVSGGAGADNITVIGAGATVDGGAGADTITVGAAVSTTLTGGAGSDNFVLTSAVVTSLITNVVTTIADIAVGDKLTFTIGGTNVFNSTKANVTAATTLANAFDIAVTAAGNTDNQISWFQYAGNTYVVNHTGASTNLDTTDVIVKVTGLVDLSTAVFAEGGAAASSLTVA